MSGYNLPRVDGHLSGARRSSGCLMCDGVLAPYGFAGILEVGDNGAWRIYDMETDCAHQLAIIGDKLRLQPLASRLQDAEGRLIVRERHAKPQVLPTIRPGHVALGLVAAEKPSAHQLWSLLGACEARVVRRSSLEAIDGIHLLGTAVAGRSEAVLTGADGTTTAIIDLLKRRFFRIAVLADASATTLQRHEEVAAAFLCTSHGVVTRTLVEVRGAVGGEAADPTHRHGLRLLLP
mmetsp:Transcript_110464/g.236008  ORF Transcript_110464/g.236008 Transcript_110464/m.236008 type:complete len:235 (+) Transcript_110464:2144-2848(+)